MRPGHELPLLYLDFDGVLCDSLEECFRSSWLALAGIPVTSVPPPDPPFDKDYRARFNACRPYIRSGEDYLEVHHWASRGEVPADQAAFDLSLRARGADALARWKSDLYTVRDALLEHHLEAWLSWNPLFPGLGAALAAVARNPAVLVLSTKKAEFIVRILRHNGVDWPLERTLYTGTRTKLSMIEELSAGVKSVLIDDQIEHLDFSHPSCACYLALWGYVAPGAAERAPARLSLTEACELISSFSRPRRAG